MRRCIAPGCSAEVEAPRNDFCHACASRIAEAKGPPKTAWIKLPWRGLELAARLMTKGSDIDGDGDRWRDQPVAYHLDKFTRHASEVAMGDMGKLANVAIRALMLLELTRED